LLNYFYEISDGWLDTTVIWQCCNWSVFQSVQVI